MDSVFPFGLVQRNRGHRVSVSAVERPATHSPGRPAISILIIDDHRSFAELLSAALNTIPGMLCVGVATSAASGISRAAELQPEGVVVDIHMPEHDGLFATRRIREVSPGSVIAVVTAYTEPEWISRAAQAGASAFIPKGGSLTELIDVLTRVRAGQMLVAPSTFNASPRLSRTAPDTGHVPLTPRELEVITYLGQGVQTEGIAKVLGVSVHTCRGYMKSLHAKLGVGTQLEAVIRAQSLGIIGVPGGH
jgi:DNA-binding NarL/FixJ family response regulator